MVKLNIMTSSSIREAYFCIKGFENKVCISQEVIKRLVRLSDSCFAAQSERDC